MIWDANKSIETTYNLLNLPGSNFRYMDGNANVILFNYTSGGRKTREALLTNGSYGQIRYYAGPFTFLNSSTDVAYVSTPYGRFVQKSSTWRHETHLRDHLGNTRLAYIHEGTNITKVQETHYYPFGHRISPLSNQPVNLGTERNNAFLYNGKEFNDDFGLNWYDYGARFYDAQVGRFHTVDPLAENYSFQSSYVYAANNPIRFIDFNGLGPQDRIKIAFSYMGTPYKQDGDRTGFANVDLATIDCSEFMMRVLFADGHFPGSDLIPENNNTTGIYEMVMSDSDNWIIVDGAENALAGDIFVTPGKHAGIISEINEDGSISIIHAADEAKGTLAEPRKNGNNYLDGYGLIFRPRNDTPDGKEVTGVSATGQITHMSQGSNQRANSANNFTYSAPGWAQNSRVGAYLYWFLTGNDPWIPDQYQNQ